MIDRSRSTVDWSRIDWWMVGWSFDQKLIDQWLINDQLFNQLNRHSSIHLRALFFQFFLRSSVLNISFKSPFFHERSLNRSFIVHSTNYINSSLIKNYEYVTCTVHWCESTSCWKDRLPSQNLRFTFPQHKMQRLKSPWNFFCALASRCYVIF